LATDGNIIPVKNPFCVRQYRDRNRPKLKFVVNFKESGKRRREFFEKKSEAETFVEQKRIAFANQGFEGLEFPSWLRVMAHECDELLSPFKRTIRDATTHYLEFLRASEKSCTVAELCGQMQLAKAADGASVRHLSDIKVRLKRFASDFGERNAATVTTIEVDEWLRALNLAPQGRNNYRAVIRSLFSYAVKRSYVSANPVANTERAKVVSEAPAILTVSECVAFLNACDSDTLPFVAISLLNLSLREVVLMDIVLAMRAFCGCDFVADHFGAGFGRAFTMRS
jgi:hypothetical protein